MKNSTEVMFGIVVMVIGVLTVLGIIYGLFAGLWGYNPTDIDWFNTKIVGTCIMLFIIDLVILKIIVEWDEI